MYGIGNRFDSAPELLFVLRAVDHRELIEQAIPVAPAGGRSSAPTIATDELGAIFDIEISDGAIASVDKKSRKRPAAKKVLKVARTTKKPQATKKKMAKPVPKKG